MIYYKDIIDIKLLLFFIFIIIYSCESSNENNSVNKSYLVGKWNNASSNDSSKLKTIEFFPSGTYLLTVQKKANKNIILTHYFGNYKTLFDNSLYLDGDTTLKLNNINLRSQKKFEFLSDSVINKFSLSDKFPHKIEIDLLSRTWILKSVNGTNIALSDTLVFSNYGTYFNAKNNFASSWELWNSEIKNGKQEIDIILKGSSMIKITNLNFFKLTREEKSGDIYDYEPLPENY